jgi:hypothetical protein
MSDRLVDHSTDDDLKMDASRGLRMNDQLDDHHDRKMDGNLYRHTNVMDDRKTDESSDVSRDLRMNDLLVYRNLDVSRDRHMNDPLDDLTMDVSRVNRRSGVHLNAQMVHDHRVDLTIDPECYVRRDLSLDAMTDGSHDHRRSDLLGDHHDRKMDGNLGGNLCLHMSDRVDDHLKDGKKSHRVDLSIDPECYVLVGHHTNVTDDRKTDENSDVKNLHAKYY